MSHRAKYNLNELIRNNNVIRVENHKYLRLITNCPAVWCTYINIRAKKEKNAYRIKTNTYKTKMVYVIENNFTLIIITIIS